MSAAEHRGPLAGLRVVELAGQGPGPFAAMVCADSWRHFWMPSGMLTSVVVQMAPLNGPPATVLSVAW